MNIKGLLANIFGGTSIVCSLVPWVLFISFTAGWSNLALSFNQTILFLVTGMALALVAAAKGSRWWALAALLPLISFFLVLASIH